MMRYELLQWVTAGVRSDARFRTLRENVVEMLTSLHSMRTNCGIDKVNTEIVEELLNVVLEESKEK